MSLTKHTIRESNQLNYGFLSSRTFSVISKILNDVNLTDDDKTIMINAKCFLQEAANGALMITTGECHGQRPSQSINALNIASDPMINLQNLLGERDVSEYFQFLTDSLPLTDDNIYDQDLLNKKNITEAQSFFNIMSKTLINNISKNLKHNGSFILNN